MSLRCVHRAAHSLSTSHLRAKYSLHAKRLHMASQPESKPITWEDFREGFEATLASGLGSHTRELRNGEPSNFKPMESKDTAQQDGTGPKPRAPSKRVEHTQRGGDAQGGGSSSRNVPRGTQEGPSKERPANLGNREASGYKTQQQTRAVKAKDRWSVKEPKIRVDETATRVLQVRDRVKADVQFAVQRTFGNKYRVEYFGSTRYGVSHSHSDLDMVVIDPDYPRGFAKKDIPESIYKPRKLATAIRHCGFIDVEFRARSTVPIVKFKDKSTGLECDLNVNGRLGIINSDMIKEYCDNSGVLRPLLFSIKEWAKPLKLNSPSGVGIPASFSSYSLALMTITFLQSEGLLPNLQADLPTLTSEQENKVFVWSQKPRRGWDVRFHRLNDYTRPVEPDVDTLLLKWFQFWTTFPFEEKCVSIRHGAFLDRDSPLLTEFLDKPASPVCVIDPFIRSKNCTVAVAKKVLNRFTAECESAAARLQQQASSKS